MTDQMASLVNDNCNFSVTIYVTSGEAKRFKSIAVTNWKPQISWNISCMLGVGHGLLLMLAFRILKSDTTRIRSFFLGVKKVGDAHSD